MRRIDVEKKQASRWPWLLGLVVLALALWGVTILLRPPPEEPVEVPGITPADTLPPTPIPGLSNGEGPSMTPDLLALLPLDDRDEGRQVRTRGRVVATGASAFWILADSVVVRVDARSPVHKGDTLTVEGTLRSADPAMTDRMTSEVLPREPGFDDWTVIRSMKLVRDASAQGDTTGTR